MNDPRVPRSEAEQMATALKRRSVPVWYVMAKDEGHGFRKKGNQDFQFYATILFTERYLLGQGGSATPRRWAPGGSGWPRSQGADGCSAGSNNGWIPIPARGSHISPFNARGNTRVAPPD